MVGFFGLFYVRFCQSTHQNMNIIDCRSGLIDILSGQYNSIFPSRGEQYEELNLYCIRKSCIILRYVYVNFHCVCCEDVCFAHYGNI